MVNEMGKVALRGNIGFVAICANRFSYTVLLRTQMTLLKPRWFFSQNLRRFSAS